jgi:hypothetical protein
MKARRVCGALAGLMSAAFLVAPPALAQAWLAPTGEASFSLGYQYSSMKDHFTTAGDRYDWGHTRQDKLLANLTYAVTDRFTVSLGLPPFYLSQYSGLQAHQYPVLDANGRLARDHNGAYLFLPPTIDDGASHGSFQDFRPELRFMAVSEPLVVTPFVGAVIPSHGYEFLGHTAVGRQLWELRTGVNLGRRLDPMLPDAYAHGRYTFSFRERAQGLRFNYSFVDLELGYFVTPSLTLRLLGAWQVAHDGLRDFEDYPEAAVFAADWQEFVVALDGVEIRSQPGVAMGLHHDQLDLQRAFDAGVGLSVAATPSLDLAMTVFHTFSGKGGHATNLGVSVGASWSFSPARLIRKNGGSPSVRAGIP